MADSNRQAGRKNSFPAQALACLLAIAVPCGSAWGAELVPANIIGGSEARGAWELLLAGIATVSLLAAIGIWISTALQGAKNAQLQRSAFINSALNTLSQGVMMTNAQGRVV